MNNLKEIWKGVSYAVYALLIVCGVAVLIWLPIENNIEQKAADHIEEVCGTAPAKYRLVGQGIEATYLEASMNRDCEETDQWHLWTVK